MNNPSAKSKQGLQTYRLSLIAVTIVLSSLVTVQSFLSSKHHTTVHYSVRNKNSLFLDNVQTSRRYRRRLYEQYSSSPTSMLLQSVAASSTINIQEEEYDHNPNAIKPKTKSLKQSVRYFTHFVITQFWLNRHERRKKQQKEKLANGMDGDWVSILKRLNKERKNLVILADYTASIVAPSFTFLLLGALMTSVVPHYWAKCMQLVATVGTSTTITKQYMFTAVGGLFLTSTAAALLTGLRGSLFWIAGARANYNVRVKLHRNLLMQEAAFFDSNETGYLLSRLNNDVNKIGQVISYHVNVVFRQLAQFLFGSIYMINISPILSLYAMLGIVLVAIISAIYGDFNRDLAQRVQDTFAEATAVSETSLSMSETIRSFDGVEIESAKYENAQGNALQLEEVQAWGYGFHKFVSDTVQEGLQVFLLIMCWYAGRSTTLAIPAEKLTTFLFYAHFVLESSNEVGDQWAKIQGAIGASQSVFDLIRRVPAVRDPPRRTPVIDGNSSVNDTTTKATQLQISNGTKKSLTTTITSSPLIITQQSRNGITIDSSIAHETNKLPIISLKNFTLTYGPMDIPALNQISLDIYRDDRVAIVGRSGSGKSSMLRSILRFYDPQSGSISLNGVNMKNMTRKEISSAISVVEQQPSLFPMTLLDNVLYGIPKDSFNPVSAEPCYSESLRATALCALAEAGLPLSSNIPTMYGNTTNPTDSEEDPNANLDLDTRVGEGGRSLSGGQRQRVAIARTLIRNPQVILLDEPTAALDSESEKKVVAALQNALKSSGDCMVMVTHRLNVVRALDVNRVIVMDQGSVVETGNPEVLLRLKPNGWYARLAFEQGISENDENTMTQHESSDILQERDRSDELNGRTVQSI